MKTNQKRRCRLLKICYDQSKGLTDLADILQQESTTVEDVTDESDSSFPGLYGHDWDYEFALPSRDQSAYRSTRNMAGTAIPSPVINDSPFYQPSIQTFAVSDEGLVVPTAILTTGVASMPYVAEVSSIASDLLNSSVNWGIPSNTGGGIYNDRNTASVHVKTAVGDNVNYQHFFSNDVDTLSRNSGKWLGRADLVTTVLDLANRYDEAYHEVDKDQAAHAANEVRKYLMALPTDTIKSLAYLAIDAFHGVDPSVVADFINITPVPTFYQLADNANTYRNMIVDPSLTHAEAAALSDKQLGGTLYNDAVAWLANSPTGITVSTTGEAGDDNYEVKTSLHYGRGGSKDVTAYVPQETVTQLINDPSSASSLVPEIVTAAYSSTQRGYTQAEETKDHVTTFIDTYVQPAVETIGSLSSMANPGTFFFDVGRKAGEALGAVFFGDGK